MVEDKKEIYLKQLEDLKRKSTFRKARKEYKKYGKDLTGEGFYRKQLYTYHKERYYQGKKVLKASEVDPIKTAALAHKLMEDGIERGYITYSFLGAQLYEKIGKGRKAIPRLLKTAEIGIKKGWLGRYQLELVYSKIESFIKKNAGKREPSVSSLEKKFAVFIVFIIGGIALSLGSLAITGNAVSNLTQTTPGLLGILLFITGLVGMFFYFRRK